MSACLAAWAAERGDEPAVTFVDYARNPETGARRTVSWSELDRWVTSLGARIAAEVRPGDRVAILAPQRLEYVVGFLAALRASAVAVPLFPPTSSGHDDRLRRVLADCAPAVVLTTSDFEGPTAGLLDEHAAGLQRPRLITVADSVTARDDGSGHGADLPLPRADDVAVLQYTSGSTRAPVGVVLTHRNITTNARQATGRLAPTSTSYCWLSWLPLFHDMGLMMGVIGPTVLGRHAVVFDPIAFLQRPARWLELMSELPAVLSGAPNFAFDLCARKVTGAARDALALGGVLAIINGSEPVRPTTLARFQEAFGPAGLSATAVRPGYGLAEATVFVTTGDAAPPKVVDADVGDLQAGRIRPVASADAPAVSLAGCGRPFGQDIAIVDPDTRRNLPAGHVGEIWVHGPNVGLGYWGSAGSDDDTFRAALNDGAGPGNDAEPLPTRPWLRTGDLGAIVDGALFVTGRRKDLIVIGGRNIYPQDIEATVEEVSPLIGRHRVVAFSVDLDSLPDPPGSATLDVSERLVVVAERYRQARHVADAVPELRRSVRHAVLACHGIPVHDFVLVEPDAITRTSSGKVARAATRDAYLGWRSPDGR